MRLSNAWFEPRAVDSREIRKSVTFQKARSGKWFGQRTRTIRSRLLTVPPAADVARLCRTGASRLHWALA